MARAVVAPAGMMSALLLVELSDGDQRGYNLFVRKFEVQQHPDESRLQVALEGLSTRTLPKAAVQRLLRAYQASLPKSLRKPRRRR